MKLNLDLTPRQYQLLLALIREEAILGRMGEKHRANVILEKLEGSK